MSDITPVEPVHFQSVGGPPYCSFFAIAPEGTKLDDVFKPQFFKRVVETLACKGRLHVDDMIRMRAADRTWDVMLVVSGFRADGSPTLVRWPTDPSLTARPELPNFIPKTLVEACQVLGVELDADEDTIKRVGDALRVGNHPDHARDEADRQRREARSKQVNAALDLLLKRKAA
jgi:DnaJ-domain-containing protein 1